MKIVHAHCLHPVYKPKIMKSLVTKKVRGVDSHMEIIIRQIAQLYLAVTTAFANRFSILVKQTSQFASVKKKVSARREMHHF